MSRFLMIGGFLGAGKTTAIARLARHYTDRGQRVGLVTNDQAYGLVDTHNLRAQGFQVGEVPGACFCCKFDELVDTLAALGTDRQPDLIITEPVGSCTDLMATVLHPLRHLFGDRYTLGPLAVLCKPEHGRKILGGGTGGFSPQAAYIFLKQLEEAQLIVLNKIDRLSTSERDDLLELLGKRFPDKEILAASGTTGAGFDAVIAVLEADVSLADRPLEIDYDTYAEGEAALGWLNCTVHLSSPNKTWSLDEVTLQLVERFSRALVAAAVEPGHVKVLASAKAATAVANWVASDAPVELSVASNLEVHEAEVLINARAHGSPEALAQHVRQTVAELAKRNALTYEIRSVQHFRPSRPEPVHRYTSPQGENTNP
ncbi:MAG: cobalamin biosynthesis protein P47K [Planctomycetes bacterium]|nr:cobalamin biosynthesis protein P47K [Planctomycetota bacterium]